MSKPGYSRLVIGLLAIGLLASPPDIARAASTAAALPRFEPAACAFKEVAADWATQNRIDCGWLHVRESRDKPGSRTLRLWVAIARADAVDAMKQADPLLYLQGGPGIATVDTFFPYFPQSKTWPGMRRTRDIVYFDQRGSGHSEPGFCPELKRELEALDKQAPPPREELERSRAAYRACREQMLATGFDFGAYNSTTTVADAEDLRRALGIGQWNLYGISYGTLVGLEYLRRQPGSVRSAILDSVFPPNSPHGAEMISIAAKGYQALQRACDADAACGKRFPGILSQLGVAIARLDATPLAREGGRITGASLGSALWTMLVKTKSAPWVPLAVERAAAGDDAIIRRVVGIYGGTGSFGDYSHGQAMTVNCYEVVTGRTADNVREMQRRYPQLGNAGDLPEEGDELCAAWQSEHAPMAHFSPVHSTVPVLLYGGEFDPATPFDDALLASRHLPNSTLVFVRGASHAAFASDDCTRGIAHAFLADPAARPELGCLAQRPATIFPTEGLEAFLESMEK